MITGGTAGIGRAMAFELARRGAAVAIVGRDVRRGRAAVEGMTRETGADHFHFFEADLSSMAGVRQLAAEVLGQMERLDVLVNNAGGFFLMRRITDDGYERTFALNHLAPFLLTHLLLPKLRASDSPRIVITASGSHRTGRIRFDDLHLQRGYRGWEAYAQSKLANVLFTRELARRLADDGIPVNCFHPGFVATNIGQESPLVRPFAKLVLNLFGRRPSVGARTGVYLVSAPEAAQVTGEYFYEGRPVPPTLPEDELDVSRRLWQISEQLTGLDPELRLPAKP